MRGFSGIGPGRLGLYALGVVALLTVGVLALAAGTRSFSGADADPTERAKQPAGAEKSTPKPVAESAARTADETEPEKKADQIQRAVKEPEPVKEEPSSASSSASATASVPADATMSLSVPAMGISDVPVVEGTTEAACQRGQATTSGPATRGSPAPTPTLRGTGSGTPAPLATTSSGT